MFGENNNSANALVDAAHIRLKLAEQSTGAVPLNNPEVRQCFPYRSYEANKVAAKDLP